MEHIFRTRLSEELLRSERRRTVILMIFFGIAVLFRVVDSIVSKADDEMRALDSYTNLWIFPFTIFLFEFISFLVIDARIKAGKFRVPPLAQYVNTTAETSIPSCIMLYIAIHNPGYDMLKSPVLNIYFLFIVLSTLRLNFKLSFICGLLAATFYTIISLFVYHHFRSSDGVRAALFLLCGIAAGLVANQIKKGINKSLIEMDKQQRVVNLFGKQVSKEVAVKMMENNGVLESKRMNVAILFADIRNFTEYVAEKSPEEIVQYQNAFFSIVVDVVEKHQGIVNQFLGDGCMITFGAPLESDNPSKQAVHAALSLLKELERNIQEGKLPQTRIGMGIHMGSVVTGNIGTSIRQQYSITGNVVILAARIEQLNKEFQSQLLVSSDVLEAVRSEHLAFDNLGDIMLKGWHLPMQIYKLA